MGPMSILRTSMQLLFVVYAVFCLISTAVAEQSEKRNIVERDVHNKDALQGNIAHSHDKRSPATENVDSATEGEGDKKRSPYAQRISGRDAGDKRSPYAKFMGSSEDDKRSPYASFMGSNAEEKRSPYAKFMGSSEDKRSPYAKFMGSNKRSPYAKFMSDSAEDKRSPYANFMASDSEDKRSPYAGFMTGEKRSPYANLISQSGDDKRSPYAKFMGSNEDKRSPYASFMGSGGDKRSPYASFMGSEDDKRSPYAGFLGSSEDKRSPYAQYISKREDDKRSPYGAYMGKMGEGKRSPYAKYMSHDDDDKRSPGFRKMRLGGAPRSIYDFRADDANIARGLRGPSMEKISDNGLVETIDGLEDTDKLNDKRIPTDDEDVQEKSQEDSIDLPPAMMQSLLTKPLDENSEEQEVREPSHGRQKRSALVYDDDKRTPYAGFREIMARNRELPVSRLRPMPGFKRTFVSLRDISNKMKPSMLWSDSYSIPRFTGSFRKRRSTDEVSREKRSAGFRSMKLNYPDYDDVDKRSPGFRYTKWQSDSDDVDKRSPGFRYMKPRSDGDRSRYHGMNFFDEMENDGDVDKRGPGFRSMQLRPLNEDLDSDDMMSDDVSKRYFGSASNFIHPAAFHKRFYSGSGSFLHPAAFHRQLAFNHRRYRG